MNNVQQDFDNCLLEIPYGFVVGEKRFYLYPITLGKSIYLRSHYAALAVDTKQPTKNIFNAANKVVKEQKDEVLSILAIHTIEDGRKIFDTDYRNARIEELANNCTDEDLTTLFVICLTKDNKIAEFKKLLSLDADLTRKEVVMSAKRSSRNIYTFGGKSILGTLIDSTMERYHWTYQYVLWGVSLQVLQMLMIDRVNTIFLTDEERRSCSVPNDTNNCIMADDPNNAATIEAMFAKTK